MPQDFNVMVGGEAGQGVQSIGAILCRLLADGGLHVFADQDYESRVRGGRNFFRIRGGSRPLRAISEKLDMLVALNPETVELHRRELKPGGIVIANGEPPGDKRHLNIPLEKLAEETAGNKLMANTVAAGAVTGLAGFAFERLTEVLRKEFGHRGEQMVKDNIAAARAGYDTAVKHGQWQGRPRLRLADGRKPRLLLNGNEALALGALAAGCKFVSGYPMTPASGVMEYIAGQEKDYGVAVVHAEDEISGINMAVGAGYAGVRAMAATSGGGFALMVEAISLAGITETPVVIVLGQRPGPATGLPTRTEQGELWFALHAGHGEFPRAVLAPASAEEAFHAAIKAFNLAEQYQTPVIVLSDHHLATSYATVDRFALSRVKINRGKLLTAAEAAKLKDYRRYEVTPSGVSPRALPGLSRALVVADSDEHDAAGHMIEDAATRNRQNLKRLRKTNGLRREIAGPKVNRVDNAVLTLIGWGSSGGAIAGAAELLHEEGIPANTVHFGEIWPFPAGVPGKLQGGGKTVVVEGNATAQLAGLIRRETGYTADHSLLKFDGRPFTPEEIVRRLKKEAFKL